MTSDVGTSAAQGTRPARLARPAGGAGPADSGPADSGPADSGTTDPGAAGGPRRPVRAALLNAGALVATTAAFAAFDPKLPHYVGDGAVMTSDRDSRPATADEPFAALTAADPAGGTRRRARAALLGAGALVATAAVFAAVEPKFPKLVGD
jgi:hypothetical protein